MKDHIRLQKIQLLIQQNKFSDAEELLYEALQQQPEELLYLLLLSDVRIQQGNFQDAIRLIDQGIRIEPNASLPFYYKGKAYLANEKYQDAEIYLDRAIAIDPEDADYFALKAHVNIHQKKFEDALTVADQALKLDAENILALNSRSTALNKLKRYEESLDTISNALREDPNNTFTHTNLGWGFLERGEHQKALEHFKEALIHKPSNENAQLGMKEAIKASNILYRGYLKYGFFMGNLTSKYQWFIIIGIYFSQRIIGYFSSKTPTLAPILIPIVYILMFLAISTWVIRPIGNLFLRFHAYGNYLLSKKEKTTSNFVGICLILFITGVILYAITKNGGFVSVALYGFLMMVPLGIFYDLEKYPKVIPTFTVVLAFLGMMNIIQAFLSGDYYNAWSTPFIVVFIAFQFVSNYLILKEEYGSHRGSI